MVCLQTQKHDFAVHTWLDYPCNPQTYLFNVVLLFDTSIRKFPPTAALEGIFLALERFLSFTSKNPPCFFTFDFGELSVKRQIVPGRLNKDGRSYKDELFDQSTGEKHNTGQACIENIVCKCCMPLKTISSTQLGMKSTFRINFHLNNRGNENRRVSLPPDFKLYFSE